MSSSVTALLDNKNVYETLLRLVVSQETAILLVIQRFVLEMGNLSR